MTYRDTILGESPGPVAYWRLNEAKGVGYLGGANVRDATGNGNTGLINGAPIQDWPGGTTDGDGAMMFKATTDFISVTKGAWWDPSGINPWSIECLIYALQWNSVTRRILGLEGTSNHGIVLFYNLSNFLSVLRGDASAGIDQPTLSPQFFDVNTWHHAIVTYDGAKIRGYFDGIKVQAGANSSRLVDTASATQFRIGRTVAAGTVNTGGIDDVSLWNYALSDAQCLAHYQAAVGANGLPSFTSQLSRGIDFASNPGFIQLGGPPPIFTVPLALPSLPQERTLVPIAHLYTNYLGFKKSLGPLLNMPKFTWTLNSGHHPVQLDLPVDDTSAIGPVQGDIVRITQQGGDGSVIYSGYVNDVQLNRDVSPPYVSLFLEPLVTELGEAYFDHNYSRVTDIGQMARDIVNATMHLSYTPQSIPNTGIGAIYNFRLTTALDALTIVKHIGGPNFWFYVDEYGIVWFQPINLSGKPYYSLTAGNNFTVRKKNAPLTSLKNKVVVAGGLPEAASDGQALTAIYTDPVSIAKYGVRFFYPILYYPTATDQGTLNRIALTVGTVMNRLRPKITLTLPSYGKRIVLGRHGGPSIRYYEPQTEPLTQTLSGGDTDQAQGNFSPNYVVLEVEMDGPQQILTLGPLPVTSDDFKYAIDGTVARLSHTLLVYPPLSTVHRDLITLGSIGGSN